MSLLGLLLQREERRNPPSTSDFYSKQGPSILAGKGNLVLDYQEPLPVWWESLSGGIPVRLRMQQHRRGKSERAISFTGSVFNINKGNGTSLFTFHFSICVFENKIQPWLLSLKSLNDIPANKGMTMYTMGVIYGRPYQMFVYMMGSKLIMRWKNSHHATLPPFKTEGRSVTQIPQCYNYLPNSRQWYTA